VITLEVRHGELIEGLTKQAADAGITHGAIVSLIGAVESFTLSTMPADDATKDVVTDYSQPAEMSGNRRDR
jgi:predicted DNA-binding protein with PD1-like motif